MYHAGAKTRVTQTKARQPEQNLLTTTIRSFDGGLNIADTDLNMSPKFAKTLDNMERGLDGSLSIRPGTVLLATLSEGGDTSDILNCYYFSDFVVSVQETGTVTRVDGYGSVYPCLIGGSPPWPPTTINNVGFTVFNSKLIIAVDGQKPLQLTGANDPIPYDTTYLQDAATASNVNTPYGHLVCTHAQYLCVAGDNNAPSTLHISAKGACGTFVGDPPPNDAIDIDLGPRVSLGSSTITGLVAYRDKLLVTFERGVLPMNLGVYTGDPAVHTPTDDGFIEEFGCIANRSLSSIGDDTFFVDNIGVESMKRITLFNTLRPVRASQLVDPDMTALLQPLAPYQVARYVFSVYDLRNSRYMIFIPRFVDGEFVESVGFSYTSIPQLKIEAWAKLRGWKWQAGCRTALQNVIFAMNNKLYSYDFDNHATRNADFVGDADFGDGTGVPITIAWELPWADFEKRMETKQMKYLGLDTKGTATFTCKAYVDNILDVFDGDTHSDAPLLSMQFVGGDSDGYGNVPYGDSPFGGGRRTAEERLYAFNAKFKLLKLIFVATTTLPLKFISVSLAYVRGSIRR